ncbi:MAG: hypothetical protein AAGF66_01930 [Cyanobacteria bacterium P01_H01_bin.119]
MIYNTTAQETASDRIVASILVLGIMFITGYTVTRVALMESAPSDPQTQINVVPHEATLWNYGMGDR